MFETREHLEITALCWNHKYSDLFAASYGSFNFYEQDSVGYICLFSLKNPSYPEYIRQTTCGVRTKEGSRVTISLSAGDVCRPAS